MRTGYAQVRRSHALVPDPPHWERNAARGKARPPEHLLLHMGIAYRYRVLLSACPMPQFAGRELDPRGNPFGNYTGMLGVLTGLALGCGFRVRPARVELAL